MRSECGKQPGHRLRVVPHAACRCPRNNPTPSHAVEPPVLEPVAGGGGENRGVEESAVEKPVGQRGVVPRVAPQARFRRQPAKFSATCFATAAGRLETRRIMAAAAARALRLLDWGNATPARRSPSPTWPGSRRQLAAEFADQPFAATATSRISARRQFARAAPSNASAIVPKSGNDVQRHRFRQRGR